MQRLSFLYDKLLETMALAACGILFIMMLMICADVLLRNVALLPHVHGLRWANEVSEYMLFLVTMLAAPWLLRQGKHIRVDVLLRVIPLRAGWYCEWVADAIAFVCCISISAFGTRAAYASFTSGTISIKTLVTPEWWSLAPLPIAFVLIAIEVVFRMHRLALGRRAPRDDIVSAS